MLNRRLFLSALLCAPATVFAAEDGFLGDILGGIADRALRDYVGQHFGDARWDGRYYNYDDHRYTRDEWRRYLEERYRWERNGGFRRVRDDDDDDRSFFLWPGGRVASLRARPVKDRTPRLRRPWGSFIGENGSRCRSRAPTPRGCRYRYGGPLRLMLTSTA